MSADKIAAHRYREQDHSTIYGNAYCWCGWSTSIFNSHKTAIALWAEHVDAVLHPTIETVEELEALPAGTVVLELPTDHVWISHARHAWHCSCDGTDVPWSWDEIWNEVAEVGHTLTVLYTPEDGE